MSKKVYKEVFKNDWLIISRSVADFRVFCVQIPNVVEIFVSDKDLFELMKTLKSELKLKLVK